MTQEAIRYLTHKDSRLGSLIERIDGHAGGPLPTGQADYGPLNYLIRAIVGQQLSKYAARTIFSRFQDLVGSEHIDARQVTELEDAELLKIGLSARKASYVKGLCLSVCHDELDLEALHVQDDDQVIEILTSMKGVGRWTAEMYLIFYLKRPDVLPCHDLGIHRGLQIAYGMKSRPSAEYVQRVGRKWSPFRTVASLYLWRAVDAGSET